MPKPKLGKSQEDEAMHYSAGAIIKKKDKFLLIDRATPLLDLHVLQDILMRGKMKKQL